MKSISKRMRHALFFISFLILFSGFRMDKTAKKKADKRPNIVFILADDMGFSDLGVTGSEIQTPNLDRMAESGILFTDMHNTSKCFPSRSCLLTGLYAQQNDMYQRPEDYHNAVMFGQVLKNAGYRTLFVGKHHGTDNPYYWGFDHYWGMRDGAANYFNPGLQRAGEPKPAQKHYGQRVFAFDGKTLQPYTPPKDYYSTDTWTDWAIQLLDQYKDEDKPFCLYLAYQSPHDPLQAPKESIQKYEGVYDVGYEAIARARYKRQRENGILDDRYPRSEPMHRKWEELSDSAKADQIRRMQVYAAMIDRMDQNIGRLIDQIKAEGKWENTLFMFASDNGASAEVVRKGFGPIGSMSRWASLEADWANVANTPFRYYKNFSYEGGTCTPFIVHWPAMISQGGRVNHTPLHFIDLMPTMVELSGGRYPSSYKGEKVHPLVGKSLLPLFKGQSLQRNQPLYFDWRRGSAIRTSQWKLVREGKKWQLFDMTEDRTETNDLAGEKPDVVKRLSGMWQDWAKRVGIR